MPRKHNVQFEEAVRTAYFNLSLARTHIHGLALVAWGVDEPRWPFFVTVMQRLRHKGLVEHSAKEGFPERIKQLGRSPVMTRYRLTRAGELTFLLLVEADMIPLKAPKKLLKDQEEYRKKFFAGGDYKAEHAPEVVV
jgi:hypothetical protein